MLNHFRLQGVLRSWKDGCITIERAKDELFNVQIDDVIKFDENLLNTQVVIEGALVPSKVSTPALIVNKMQQMYRTA